MKYHAVFSLSNKLLKNDNKSLYVIKCREEIGLDAENAESALNEAKNMMEKRKGLIFKKEIENNQNWQITII